jgi:hypothetical protein
LTNLAEVFAAAALLEFPGYLQAIRITMTSDGVLTEYGEKVERERLARLAAANQDKGGEPSSE